MTPAHCQGKLERRNNRVGGGESRPDSKRSHPNKPPIMLLGQGAWGVNHQVVQSIGRVDGKIGKLVMAKREDSQRGYRAKSVIGDWGSQDRRRRLSKDPNHKCSQRAILKAHSIKKGRETGGRKNCREEKTKNRSWAQASGGAPGRTKKRVVL